MGVMAFIAATGGILVCRSAEQFIALRFLQALGGGVAAVNTAAVVGDLFRTQQAAKTLNAIAVVALFAPLLGPSIGAAALGAFSWQAIFVILLLYAGVVWLLVWRRFPETVSRAGQAGRSLVRHSLQGFAQVARRTRALAYAVSMSLAMGALLVFLTDAAFVYMDQLGASPRLLGLFSALNVIALILGNRLNRRLLKTIPVHRVIPFGSGFQVLAALALWLHVSVMSPSLVIVVPLVMSVAGALGLIVGNATASCLAWFPEGRGAAAGVIGSLPALLGGLFGAALGVMHDGALGTTAGVMLLSALLGLLALIPARPAPPDAVAAAEGLQPGAL